MGNIIPIDPGGTRAGGGGDGPEGPMLERVKRLETDIADIKTALDDIKIGLAKIDGKFDRVYGQFDKVEGQFGKVDGRFTGLEGYLKGIDARIASLPTVWTMLGIVFTTWALGSGILIFAMNVLKK
jgi:archaellum component FlaC